jgi:pyrimidine deaminase RibD-like protein
MANKIKKMFRIAKEVAKCGDCVEAKRNYRLGAVGIRTDGTLVCSSNITTREPRKEAHAEYRVCQKLNIGSVIFVVRIGESNRLRMARPCKDCQSMMKNGGIDRVYYSISDNEYGVIRFV